MLSIIVPTYNEMAHGDLQAILASLADIPDTEILCVDSGSTDDTLDCINTHNTRLIQINETSRAARLNAGVANAQGDVILLYHPRILIAQHGIEALQQEPSITWGGFTHQFTHWHPLLRFISWYSNHVRFKRKHIVYLDHGIFFHKRLGEQVFPISDEPIFEDTELSWRLSALTPPRRLQHTALVSPIRFLKNGPVRQFLGNQLLKLCFHLGVNPKRLNDWYERGLRLNG